MLLAGRTSRRSWGQEKLKNFAEWRSRISALTSNYRQQATLSFVSALYLKYHMDRLQISVHVRSPWTKNANNTIWKKVSHFIVFTLQLFGKTLLQHVNILILHVFFERVSFSYYTFLFGCGSPVKNVVTEFETCFSLYVLLVQTFNRLCLNNYLTKYLTNISSMKNLFAILVIYARLILV